MSDIVGLMILCSALLLLLGTIILIVGMFTNKNSKDDYILEMAQGISAGMMIAAGIICFVAGSPKVGGFKHSEILILPTLSLLFGTIILLVGMTTNKNGYKYDGEKGSTEYKDSVMDTACGFAIVMFIVAAIILFLFYYNQ